MNNNGVYIALVYCPVGELNSSSGAQGAVAPTRRQHFKEEVARM